jgi:hypothetical protein
VILPGSDCKEQDYCRSKQWQWEPYEASEPNLATVATTSPNHPAGVVPIFEAVVVEIVEAVEVVTVFE